MNGLVDHECPTCGASLPAARRGTSAKCRFCQTEVAVDPAEEAEEEDTAEIDEEDEDSSRGANGLSVPQWVVVGIAVGIVIVSVVGFGRWAGCSP